MSLSSPLPENKDASGHTEAHSGGTCLSYSAPTHSGGPGVPGVYQLADSPSKKGEKKGEKCHPQILSHETAAGHAPGLG